MNQFHKRILKLNKTHFNKKIKKKKLLDFNIASKSNQIKSKSLLLSVHIKWQHEAYIQYEINNEVTFSI